MRGAGALALTLAALGCGGYAEGTLTGSAAPQDAALPHSPQAHPSPPPAQPPASAPATEPADVDLDAGPPAHMAAASRAAPDAAAAPEPPRINNLRIARSDDFDAYFTDALGRPLYMYARDVPGAQSSACLGDCARQWPAFDMAVVTLDAPLQAAHVTRIHRQDGAYQTAYKGHPLYYRAAELNAREVTADGLELRWFVARDYLAFLAAATSFIPLGGMAGDGLYLTDGFGRPLYVCLDDVPRSAAEPASSSCGPDCIAQRPVFDAAQTAHTTRLPSVLNVHDLNELVRADGSLQLTYRGWPLYYFSGDLTAHAPEGHNERAWRVVDPISFGRAEQPALEP